MGGAVESDLDVTFLGTSFFGGTGKLSARWPCWRRFERSCHRPRERLQSPGPPTFTLHFYGPRPRPFPHLPPVFSGSITCFERETVEGVDLVKSVLEKRRGAWCTGSSSATATRVGRIRFARNAKVGNVITTNHRETHTELVQCVVIVSSSFGSKKKRSR